MALATRSHAVHERVEHCAGLAPEQVFSELGVPEEGLSTAQADEMREKYGRNEVSEQEKDSVLRRLRRAFINPFTLMLLILASLSLLTYTIFSYDFNGSAGTTVIILTMLLASGGVRFFEEMRAKRLTEGLVQLVDTTVQVCRDGRWRQLDSEELTVGDRVRLDAGDRVPADIRLVKVQDFFVSQSMITGESGILEKTPDALNCAAQALSDYNNTVFLGSTVTGGVCEGVVMAVGKDTVYGSLSLGRNDHKHEFDQGENEVAWVLIRFMALLVPLVFAACGLTKGDWLDAFLFALSVAVGLTPELMPMVITACMARGSVKVSRQEIVVKNMNAMQTFGSMDVLCVDKTGTLTGDKVQLEYYMDVLGNESGETLDCAYLNSYHHTGLSNHLDLAILQARDMPGRAGYFADLAQRYEKLDELPFDYDRRLASVLLRDKSRQETDNCSNLLIVKGGIREVAQRCSCVRYHGEDRKADADEEESIQAVVDEMLEDGMKVLAVACKNLEKDTLCQDDERDLALLGYLAFFDAPKQSAASALRKLKDLNIEVKVLTGDQADVAASVCRRLGVETDVVYTGRDLENMDERKLSEVAEEGRIFAELSPKQKVQLVESLQNAGHEVGFLGDGMNDLPAEVQADTGISVDTAMEAVKDSADVILMKKDLDVLDDGVVEGRKSFVNMTRYVKITASTNFGNILAIVIASVILPFLPMTAVQLLMLNLLYDMLCLALPWDRVDSELCARPLGWSADTIGRFMVFFGPISTAFDLITFAFLFFFLCPAMCGGSYAALDAGMQAQFISLFQTGWFLESMWTQVLILYLLRTERIDFLKSRTSVPVMTVTLTGIILYTVMTFTPAGSIAGLTSMPFSYFIFIAVMVIAYMASVTLAKQCYLKRYGRLI